GVLQALEGRHLIEPSRPGQSRRETAAHGATLAPARAAPKWFFVASGLREDRRPSFGTAPRCRFSEDEESARGCANGEPSGAEARERRGARARLRGEPAQGARLRAWPGRR